jgi:tetratricopeptide (TPR) repeat protein
MRFRRILAIALLLAAGAGAALYWTRALPKSESSGAAVGGAADRPAAMLAEIQSALDEGRAAEAERQLRAFLDVHPDSLRGHRLLARLLLIEGRRFEAAKHLTFLLQSGEINLEELVLLGDGRTDYDAPDELEKYRRAVPDDPRPLLAIARVDFREGRTAAARERLETIVAFDPGQIEAQAWLGRALLGLDDHAGLMAWHAALPSEADAHPTIWLVRGLFARAANQPRAAARCFWEAIRLDPNDAQAHAELAHQLNALGEAELAARFHARATDLHELINRLKSIYTDRERLAFHPDAVQRVGWVAVLMESLGRPWEAAAWRRRVLKLDPRHQESEQVLERLQSTLASNAARTLPEANLALHCDLSAYPLPNWKSIPAVASVEGASQIDDPLIRFEDHALAVGLAFSYFDRPDPDREGLYMRETTGGGVAALDYDGDGWPDVYFTQGCRWPPDPSQRDRLDALFRNTGAGRFVDVTPKAGLGDERFGQGQAVGDYDNDGFADLYVANIGGNRLYRNNGDGTFHDATLAAGIVADDWTTSCLIADVNGDGWPDLFDVNYLEGHDVHTLVCQTSGRRRVCTPFMFAPQQDRLWLNLGNGCFADHSESAGILAPGGNGLGIVAADFDGDGRLEIFVANDQTPNFLFVNQAPPGAPPEFAEQALLKGVAVDREGRSQACMGVAVDDVDGDGLLDMAVTNFFLEANALYVQSASNAPGGLFMDRAVESGLAASSLAMVGFGAQFLDADLDGWPDLIVTNGHIDDYRFRDEPLHMRPQFFRNLGGARFQEATPESLGSFFQGEYLGRGLARLDWNRDGRDDVVISHREAPAALLTNRTQRPGRRLTVQLRGVSRDRDAVGTIVGARFGDRLLTKQLTAGDGYQASNQRQLTFGLGARDRVEALSVQWTSGLAEEFHDLPADTAWLIVEGLGQPVRMPLADE